MFMPSEPEKTLEEQIAESEKEVEDLKAEAALEQLNPRQRAFVAEYLKDLNATAAAIRAGYSSAAAAPIASRLLTDAKIAFAVERGKAQRLERINTTADSVVHELSLLAASNVEHYYIDDYGQLKPTPEAPDGAMRAVRSIKRKVRHDKEGGVTYELEFTLWDKPGSLKLMGRHAGAPAFFDRVEHTGPKGGPIEFANLSTEELLERHKALAAIVQSPTE